MVRCRGCLEVTCQLKALERHCKRHHNALYKANKKKPRRFFIAQSGQTIPDDPNYQKQKH